MYEHGRLQEVQIVTFGSELSADTSAGAMSLAVEDAADFDEGGGTLVINDQVVVYASVDDDTGVIFLDEPLAADADEGDRVKLYDPLYQVPVTSKVAQVKVDGDLDDADAIEAVIALHLINRLDEGIRGMRGESVLLELDDDEWRVVDVYGFGDPEEGIGSGISFFQESKTVTVPGDQTISLTFTPAEHSEHVYWNGIYQPAAEWSRSSQVLTIPDPDEVIQVGDVLVVEYAYRFGAAVPVLATLVPYESTGWKYLAVTEGDTTDRSAVGFDDSGWSTGWAAFGYPTAPHPVHTTWPVPHTAMGSVNSGLWLRRIVDTADRPQLLISLRVDGEYWLYADGTLIASGVGGTSDVPSVSVPTPGDATVIAIHLNDDAADPPTIPVDYAYLDAEIVG